jgi:hypothetical protein
VIAVAAEVAPEKSEMKGRRKARFGGQSTVSLTHTAEISGVMVQPGHGEAYRLTNANVCTRCNRARPNETLTVRDAEKLCRDCLVEESGPKE